MSEIELPSHLKLVNPDEFRISRRKWGKGYRFFYDDEISIEDRDLLEIVKNVPVPDTWSEVTLSDKANTYILARGYDGSGKLQYLYHPDFIAYRNEQKFSELINFGLSLPRIRRRLLKDLKSETWNEGKLMALIVRILDKYHLRIGSRIYAKNNHSFGLTTLRKRHFKEDENGVMLQFIGKSGQHQNINLDDDQLVRLIEEVAEFPGWELFSFTTENGRFSADASKVNNYIRRIAGGEFSARNFRTWAGTVLIVKYLPTAKKMAAKNPRRKLSAVLVDMVAEKLGNTPSICRQYYIHPEVLDNVLMDDFNCEPCDNKFLKNPLYRKYECRTLEILSKL